MSLSEQHQPTYLELIAKFNKGIAASIKQNKPAYLPKGKSDVFRVFMKHGALSNQAILSRLYRYHGIDTFKKQNRRNNFTQLCMWIAANVCLESRTFSLHGTQDQIAEVIGVNQSTISRLLELLIKMRVIAPAFSGDHNPDDKKAGLVYDERKIPLNQIYKVLDDFGYLAGKTVGDKLVKAFQNADEKAFEKTKWTLQERLLTIRNTLWEGTIERRIKNITTGCLKRTLSSIKDRSRAAQIIFTRMKKRGEHLLLNEDELNNLINFRLKSCGFNP